MKSLKVSLIPVIELSSYPLRHPSSDDDLTISLWITKNLCLPIWWKLTFQSWTLDTKYYALNCMSLTVGAIATLIIRLMFADDFRIECCPVVLTSAKDQDHKTRPTNDVLEGTQFPSVEEGAVDCQLHPEGHIETEQSHLNLHMYFLPRDFNSSSLDISIFRSEEFATQTSKNNTQDSRVIRSRPDSKELQL